MTDSRQLARLIGPAMVAVAATEALNWSMFAQQIAPIVYLNGAILFVAGLALVNAHNRWVLNWPVLITITGWVLVAAGLYRMIAPEGPQAPQHPSSYAMLAALGGVGALLSFKGYLQPRRE